LASGILTGKYALGHADQAMRLQREELAWLKERNVVEEKLLVAQNLAQLAAELSITPAQLAIAWSASNPRVSCTLLGATRVEQLKENLRALDALTLFTPELVERIEGIVQNKPVPPAF
jgi:aryl-alcohol dehydrogenase-like predicted oxidoreductase